MKKIIVIGVVFLFFISTIPIVSAKTKTITDSTGDVYHIYEVNSSRYYKIVERPNLDITEFSYIIESGYLEMQLKIAGEFLKRNNTQYFMVFFSRSNLLFSTLDTYEFYYQNGSTYEKSPTKLIDYEIGSNFIRCRFDFKKNQDSFYWFGFGGTIEHSDGEYIDQCPNFGPPFTFAIVGIEGLYGISFEKYLKILSYNSYNQTLNISIDVFSKGIFGISNLHNGPINITIEPNTNITIESNSITIQNFPGKIQKPFIGTVCFYTRVQDSDVSMYTEYFTIGQLYFLQKGWFKLSPGDQIITTDLFESTVFLDESTDIYFPKIKFQFFNSLIQVSQ